jgi:hypothetical protein
MFEKKLSTLLHCQKTVCLAALSERCLLVIIRKLSTFAVSVRELSAMLN